MKLLCAAVLAAAFATPAIAAPTAINFEKSWDFLNGDINGYYAGGKAADGTSGPNLGVSFVNISGLSNDASFTYYTNAPSPLGVAYAHTFLPGETAFINTIAGVARTLSFFYSSPSAAPGAVRAFSGYNGTGTLLGTLDLVANTLGDYDVWTPVTFNFAGIARSIDFTGSANLVAFDNLALAVPEPTGLALAGIGAAALLAARRRRGRG